MRWPAGPPRLAGLYFAGVAPLAGAYVIAPALDPSVPVAAAADGLERSAELYPPGAVDGAVWFSDWAAARWSHLDQAGRDAAMSVLEEYLRRALERDPHNSRIAVALAAVYQYRSGRGADERYVALAGEMVRRALRLAPGFFEARYRYIVQVAMERGPGYALAVLELHLEEYPGSWKLLDGLHYRLSAALELGVESGGR